MESLLHTMGDLELSTTSFCSGFVSRPQPFPQLRTDGFDARAQMVGKSIDTRGKGNDD